MISDEYAAGFFDGEGCVAAYLCTNTSNGKAYKALTYYIGIVQGSSLALQELKDKYGGSLRLDKNLKSKFSNRDFWRWTIRGKEGDRFVQAIRPYAIEKKDQLVVFQHVRETVGKPFGNKISSDVWELREMLVQQLKDLKRAS